jgi:hypothetical protein
MEGNRMGKPLTMHDVLDAYAEYTAENESRSHAAGDIDGLRDDHYERATIVLEEYVADSIRQAFKAAATPQLTAPMLTPMAMRI